MIFITPLLFIGIIQQFHLLQFNKDFNISIDKGYSTLSNLIDENYREMPTVINYIEEVDADSSINKIEKEAKIKELQDNIAKLEDDKEI